MSDAKAEHLLGLSERGFLVTGGSGGIGGAVVARLTSMGARVSNLDVAPRETVAESFVQCDLGDPESIPAAVDQAVATLGRLDGLVHCAGVAADGVLWKVSPASWDRVIQVNLCSAFHLLRAATPHLRERGGTVVFVTSINGERGKFGQSSYSASKGGLIAFGKTAARELGRFDVRVNCVAPGMVETPMVADLPAEITRRAREESVLGRIATPDDVANTILFLCSSLARHVTGQTIRVDGGQLIA